MTSRFPKLTSSDSSITISENTSSTDLTVTASGANESFFDSYATGAQSSVTGDNTAYLIQFDNELADIGGDYNTATGIYTAPVDGFYFFTSCVLLGGITASHTTGKVFFTKNGSEIAAAFRGDYAQVSDAGNNLSVPISGVVFLEDGDELAVYTQISGGTKVVNVLQGSGVVTSFSGYLIKEITN